MAIKGGCSWIVLGYDNSDDSKIKKLAEEFLPICREAGAILTLENRPELARELGVHGVLLSDKEFHATKIREDLGAEAIIGVVCDNVPAMASLKSADIDYIQLPTMPNGLIANLVNTAREAGIKTAIVATGDFLVDDVDAIMSTGVNGIATGRAITNTSDPIKTTIELIETLKQHLNKD